ncbi:MAG: hypothetical protein IPK82_23380 [Polyangiaceae bacterium]|nr:hypothetical protein [Polyangiaceae bacterium]
MTCESKNLSRITGAAAGTGLAVGADQDWLQVIGIILAAISTLAPLLQKLLAKKRDGNDLPLLLSLLLPLSLSLFLLGCGTTFTANTDGSSISGSATNSQVEVGGGYNGETGEWHVGIAIHFKTWPDDDTREALQDAGAHLKKSKGDTSDWVLAAYDRTNPFHGRALELALKSGAVLTGAKVSREGAKGAK